MCENHVLVLPVNILTVWRAGFTWLHDTLPCVLIQGRLSQSRIVVQLNVTQECPGIKPCCSLANELFLNRQVD